ncbi:hypothetical protein BRADI_1g00200v3 [Brachypodium distachyon]|uniref:glutathione transferase n=1 Tax=Brachypodium distachyon TaxID=15368 RepID=I1GKD6_BRADI|nr:hypothetical protein BRADI_1g00200v3 [Brachypodium distachyon]
MAGDDELKLLGTWASAWAARVKIALHLKGLSYEYVEQDLDNKSEFLLSSNPVHKKVPVLIHNGKAICESLVILEYIDEAFDATGPSLRTCLAVPWAQAFKANTEEEKAQGLKQTLAAAEMLEGALKECSKGKLFFGGDNVGYMDIALGGLIMWLQETEELCGAKLFDTAKTPLLLEWMQRFSGLDAAKVSLQDGGRLVEFAKMRWAQMAAATTVPPKN